MASPLRATAEVKNVVSLVSIALWVSSKMADEDDVCRVSAFEKADEVLSLLWGQNVSEDIFERWSQGRDF